jgi:hypothetical protein
LVIAFLRLYVFNSIQCGTVGAWMRTVDATAQKAPVHCYTAVDVFPHSRHHFVYLLQQEIENVLMN